MQILFIDCPGFDDNEGFWKEILNAFSYDYLFENYSGNENLFKIFLVVSYNDLQSSRGEKMLKDLDRLEQMFIDESNWQEGIGFIFTKTKHKTVENILALLNDNPPKELIKWIHFIENHKDHVFFFPKPSKKDVGSLYDFEDHEKLLEFLQRNPLDNPNHKITLSEAAIHTIREVRNDHILNVNSKVQNICAKINERYRKEAGTEELNYWLDILFALLEKNVKTANEFGNTIKELIPDWEWLKNDIDSLEEFELFDNFIDKILCIPYNNTCLKDVIHAWCGQCCSELQKLYIKATQLEHSKEIIKEKDATLKEFENKFQRMEKLLKDREIELKKEFEEQKKLIEKQKNEEIEKVKREHADNLEEMNKKIDEINANHQKEISKLTEASDKHKKDIENLVQLINRPIMDIIWDRMKSYFS